MTTAISARASATRCCISGTLGGGPAGRARGGSGSGTGGNSRVSRSASPAGSGVRCAPGDAPPAAGSPPHPGGAAVVSLARVTHPATGRAAACARHGLVWAAVLALAAVLVPVSTAPAYAARKAREDTSPLAVTLELDQPVGHARAGPDHHDRHGHQPQRRRVDRPAGLPLPLRHPDHHARRARPGRPDRPRRRRRWPGHRRGALRRDRRPRTGGDHGLHRLGRTPGPDHVERRTGRLLDRHPRPRRRRRHP